MSVRGDQRAVIRWWVRGFGILALASLLPTCGPNLSLRTFVRERTYPGGRSRDVPVDYELLTYAMLRPALDRPYVDCAQASRLIERYDAQHLIELGDALRRETVPREWKMRLRNDVRRVEPSHVDPLLELAIGEAASDLSAFLETSQPSVDQRHRALRAVNAVLATLAHQIGETGESCGRGLGDSPTAPSTTLALSGGAANGAFTAGFLFELFYLRERLAADLTGAGRDEFLRSSEFATTTGTSVGALLAQVVDIYYTRHLGRSRSAVRELLRAFRAGELRRHRYDVAGPGPLPDMTEAFLDRLQDDRTAQVYALALIQEYFTDLAEPEAVCVQPGSITRQVGILGDREVGLMRFDPLQRNVIDDVLDATGSVLLDNSMRRIVLSVEVLQNAAVGLDERACVGLHGPELSECLAAGMMASVVLPVFAQPVNRVRTGVRDGPTCGIWLDAGIRNGFPVYHALVRSRPSCEAGKQVRTLAISTDRVSGTPTAPTEDSDQVLSIALQAIGEMGNQLHVMEATYAGAYASIQQDRYSLLALDREELNSMFEGCATARQDVADCRSALQTPTFGQEARDTCRRRLDAVARQCRLAFATRQERSGSCADSLPESSMFRACAAAIVQVGERCGSLADSTSPAVPPGDVRAACAATLDAMASACAESGIAEGPSPGSNAWLELVFVPTNVPHHIGAPTGYAFDPYVMRGLFLHGRHEALRRMDRPPGTGLEGLTLMDKLGWRLLGVAEARLRELRDADRAELAPWMQFYAAESQAAERLAAGRARFDSGAIADCAEAPLFGQRPLPPDNVGRVPGYFGGAQCE